MTYLEHYLRQASEGRSILIIGSRFMTFSAQVNGGTLFIRNHCLNGLRSVAVDTVVFFGPTPPDTYLVACERCRVSKSPRVEVHDSTTHDAEYKP
jgi:hypothetical protein